MLGDVDAVAIVKEVAPTKDAKNDDELGVGDFQRTYWKNYPTYMDPEKDFYKVLGSKPFSLWSIFSHMSLNPFSGFGLGIFGERWKKQGISQNMKGDYHLKGGLLIYKPDGKVHYQQGELETEDLKYDEIIAAALKLAPPKK